MSLFGGNVESLTAIDMHVHLEPEEDNTIDAAAKKYFGDSGAARDRKGMGGYYRSRRIGFVVFAVDESLTGKPRVTNDEVVAFATANADIAIPFASIDPKRGSDGVAEAQRLVSAGVVHGLKLHPPVQQFIPNDRIAYPLYEIFAKARLPALFHSGHSGIGTGLPGGGGLLLRYSNPMCLAQVAADFPEMQIVLAHPSSPWQDEAISVCLHKANVWIDLSGWSPRYFPPQLVQYANGQLRHKMLFGSDFPLITTDRWLKDFNDAAFKPEVRELILKQNAIKALKLDTGA